MLGGSEVSSSHLTFSHWVADTLVRWRMIAATIGVLYLLAAIAVLVIPPVYRSETSFVANSSANPKMPALSGTGAIAGLATQLGVNGGADPSESPAFYNQLIDSRELLTRLAVSRFKNPRSANPADSLRLVDIFRIRKDDPQRRLELAIKQLHDNIHSDFSVKTNLVWMDVDAQWPELSAAIASRATALVTAFNKEQRVSRARSKRIFLESRVDTAEMRLRDAEERQRTFYEQNRLWRNAPDLTFEEGRLRREADIANDLYLTLQHQLEAARLDEFNDAALITVVDSAVPPRKARWPRYGVLLITTTLAGLILGTILAGCSAVLDDWRARNPGEALHIRGAFKRARSDLRRVIPIAKQRANDAKAVP
jgi:Uncharacterized protein involved in exopolysaccharide biosynthesis